MNGILLVDKPSGWTSFDVVAKVRGLLKQSGIHKPKVGHTGTLDPLATGLLVLLIGSHTKKATELSKLDKTYEVTMKLGEVSTTGDAEGEITERRTENGERSEPTMDEVEAALQKFTGEIMQTPPAFSAMKINGQRVYKLARAGKAVKLEPRPVTIYGIELVDCHYPSVNFIATVSSGTYIRSLVVDVGETLGTGAYMSALRRTRVGEFELSSAIDISNANYENINNNIQLN